MKKRPLPKHCDMFLACARKARLSHALGRALYGCNRIQNGDFPWAVFSASCQYGMMGSASNYGLEMDHNKALIKQLKTIRPSTAIRWAKHWKSGGSIKSLSHGSAGRIRHASVQR